jgi:hypothetical protein
MLKLRASPDMLPFSLCNKKRHAIRHMNRPLFPTVLFILSYDIRKWVGLRTYQHPLYMAHFQTPAVSEVGTGKICLCGLQWDEIILYFRKTSCILSFRDWKSCLSLLMLLECSSVPYSTAQHGKTQETATLYIVLMSIIFVRQFVEKWYMQSWLHIEKLKKFQSFLQPKLLLFLINTQELFNSLAPELNSFDQCKRQESKWPPLLHWWQLYPIWHFKPHTALSTVASVRRKSVTDYLACTNALQIAVWLI